MIYSLEEEFILETANLPFIIMPVVMQPYDNAGGYSDEDNQDYSAANRSNYKGSVALRKRLWTQQTEERQHSALVW